MQTKPKVKDKTDLTIPDDLSIPAFLRRVQSKKEKQDSLERQLLLRTSNFRPSLPPLAEKPKDDLVEKFRAEEEARHLAKAQNRIAKMLSKKQSQEIPPGARWDTTRCKWVVDNLASKPTPKLTPKPTLKPTPTPKPLMSKVAVAKPVQLGSRKPGLISTIIELMLRPSGVSVDEVLKVMAERFPGRVTKPNTINYHARVNSTSVVEDKKRGKVFYRKAV